MRMKIFPTRPCASHNVRTFFDFDLSIANMVSTEFRRVELKIDITREQ